MSSFSTSKWIAVLGGALVFDDRQVEAAHIVGAQAAIRGFGIVTGATTGLPFAAALGAKQHGGTVIGISPSASPEEHIRTRPLEAHDFVVFSGLGAEGRAPLILRSVSAAIFVGGEMGTLNEFAVGWMLGVPLLGLLTHHGGITAEIVAIAKHVQSSWGSELIAEADPETLVTTIAQRLQSGPSSPRAPADQRVHEILARRLVPPARSPE